MMPMNKNIKAWKRKKDKVYIFCKKELYQFYIVEQKSIRKIAILFGVCAGTIWKNLQELNILRRSLRESHIGQKTWNTGMKYNKDRKKRLNLRGLKIGQGWNRGIQGKKSHSWINGSSFEPYTSDFNKSLKEQIRNRDGRRCQLCNCPEVECLEKLHIHHINYDKKCNIPHNLISLCKNCHNKTHHNREYWEKLFNEKITYIYSNSK